MKADEYLHKELTFKIIGALFTVHNQLGNSYQEKYYQRAIEIELTKLRLKFDKEFNVPVLFNGKKIGHHALDFFIEQAIVLEIKTIPRLGRKEMNQTLGYMNYLQKRVGILANFRTQKLEYQRLLLPSKYLKTVDDKKETSV